MSGRSIDANAAPLTDETLAAVKGAYAVLLGGPELGTGAVRPQKGLLKLRKRMGTYGGLRPVCANFSLFHVGEGLLNPFGTILTVAMILPYSLNLPEGTKAVEGPVCVALEMVLRATGCIYLMVWHGGGL
ncbi:3-isopropylmalate dehydrogenase [Fusarium circinatum]|uniref:3-isopropylmalate dehydrogenase n=1 Tax=Fusarium circinatum TaxID=48490 RepID=A0A8H5WLG6_FUSCI|nr:3-isopropylmalate dehydrogenase [Fusarium circinatum]